MKREYTYRPQTLPHLFKAEWHTERAKKILSQVFPARGEQVFRRRLAEGVDELERAVRAARMGLELLDKAIEDRREAMGGSDYSGVHGYTPAPRDRVRGITDSEGTGVRTGGPEGQSAGQLHEGSGEDCIYAFQSADDLPHQARGLAGEVGKDGA